MNHNGLTKHYDVLTRWERVPLILAATARGDEAETERLANSAPRHGFKVADCYGLIQGLEWLASYYLLNQLDLVVHYQTAMIGSTEERPSLGAKKMKTDADRLWKIAQWYAYWFLVTADAWKRVCAEMMIDPEIPLRDNPGYENVKRLESVLRQSAFSAEEAADYFAQLHQRQDPMTYPNEVSRKYQFETAEEMAERWGALLVQCSQNWG